MRANRDLTNVAGIRGKSQMGCERASRRARWIAGSPRQMRRISRISPISPIGRGDPATALCLAPVAKSAFAQAKSIAALAPSAKCATSRLARRVRARRGARRTGPRYPQWPHQVALGEECPVDPRNLTNDANSPGSPTLTRSALLQPWTGLGIAGGEETGFFCF